MTPIYAPDPPHIAEARRQLAEIRDRFQREFMFAAKAIMDALTMYELNRPQIGYTLTDEEEQRIMPKLSEMTMREVLRANNPPQSMLHAAVDQLLDEREELGRLTASSEAVVRGVEDMLGPNQRMYGDLDRPLGTSALPAKDGP